MSDLIERPNAKHFNFTIGVNEDGILYVPFREVVNNIQSFQTVNAIPVDFIESWIDSNMVSTEDRDFYAEDCIRRLVQDWRKKNDK